MENEGGSLEVGFVHLDDAVRWRLHDLLRTVLHVVAFLSVAMAGVDTVRSQAEGETAFGLSKRDFGSLEYQEGVDGWSLDGLMENLDQMSLEKVRCLKGKDNMAAM